MLETIAIVILISSTFGIGIIILTKLPVIKELSEESKDRIENSFLLKLEKTIKSFLFESYLEKILSKIRVLTLKVDRKTSNWLQEIRKHSQENKIIEKDDKYWEKIEKLTAK